ncbi:MAG: 16S rRNA (guanine(527)-N(7))-methyltransferase RsmG [Acidobacteriota bacterium]|nr:16S rRNA (guanine(527)-N(7))-methyltransferase RsmG [Blastocatellia bacterium]MDQ3220614.1 16S rRNA (guanine(527)-N(7))-methyltransferase RsmG [Acidobacteriota bacterium]MDQ3490301.1 16S rRNA (guanine(527)-N(7))-methyltransferase RsmG [Acidobacteriota bacterium]
MRDVFINAVKSHQASFRLELLEKQISRLADYYEIVHKHNEILHLVAPMPPQEFTIRHILESLTLLEFLPENTRFADVGTGAGLPSIPCLLVREDLRAVLIESKLKKTKFLEEAAAELKIADRVRIINRQFEEIEGGQFTIVTCRALDKFSDKVPRLLKWSKRRSLLLFGGNNLREALITSKLSFAEKLMPLSDQRFLFVVSR